jgi:hypothetical protein
VSGVVEVTDVDGPDGDADEGDDLEGEVKNKFKILIILTFKKI